VLIASNYIDSISALLLRLEDVNRAITQEPNHLDIFIYLRLNEAGNRMIAGQIYD
jgi:hypothetical protein